jgi:hypothetical protein
MQMSRWTKLRERSAAERSLLFLSLMLLPLIHFGLLVLGYSRLLRVLEVMSPANRCKNPKEESEIIRGAQQMARIVSIAARRGFFRATCLRSSLLLWWLLRWHGIRSDICFGVRKEHDQLEAHAWVEYQGTVLNDLADTRKLYQAFGEALPSTTRGL